LRVVFDIMIDGPPTDIERDKDRMLGDAVQREDRRNLLHRFAKRAEIPEDDQR
jgi:hypothetical protein